MLTWLQSKLQHWIDRKAHQEKMRGVIAISELPGITIGEFYRQAEQYLEESETD